VVVMTLGRPPRGNPLGFVHDRRAPVSEPCSDPNHDADPNSAQRFAGSPTRLGACRYLPSAVLFCWLASTRPWTPRRLLCILLHLPGTVSNSCTSEAAAAADMALEVVELCALLASGGA